MLRFRYSNPFSLKKEKKITDASWDHFQLVRSIEMTINNAETQKNRVMMNEIMPESLKNSTLEREATYIDNCVYQLMLKVFLDYISEYKKELISSNKKLLEMLSVEFAIEDREIVVLSVDRSLVHKMQKALDFSDFHSYKIIDL